MPHSSRDLARTFSPGPFTRRARAVGEKLWRTSPAALGALLFAAGSLLACQTSGSVSLTGGVPVAGPVFVDAPPWSVSSILVGVELPIIEEQFRTPEPVGVSVEVVASGLEVPWAMAFTPDGRLLVTERAGRIRVIRNGVLGAEPFATVGASQWEEGGLLGLAVDPGFSENQYVYIYYTYMDGEGVPWNRVARLTDNEGYGREMKVLVDRIPAGPFHNGGRIRFGPDGKLYVTTGDATQPETAQDLGSLAGKVLRVNSDGSVPADNPFPGSVVYSYGHRNPQGLAWHPVTGKLYVTEHGPTGEFGLWDNDEVNIVKPRGNYGWPRAVGAPGHWLFMDPIMVQTPAIAPSGASFYSGSLFPEWHGNLFIAGLRGQQLQRVALQGSDLSQVRTVEELFLADSGKGVYGRLRDVAVGPDGAIYVTTSNRDGRAVPGPADDMVLRLVPKQNAPSE
ncbi:MAG: PQQ-dependent sugar dehydrogenase [Chloroflexi bacterium]|nr:PQQ-dependent sugar dehydrogenase [Chloroflexota bacterium]